MNDLDLIRELLESPTRIVLEAQRRLKRAKLVTMVRLASRRGLMRRRRGGSRTPEKGLVKAPGDP